MLYICYPRLNLKAPILLIDLQLYKNSMKKFLHLGFLIGCQIQMLFAKKRTLKNSKKNNQTMVMAQNFLPEIYNGDYRILLIHGKPFPIALARIPMEGSFKGNLAAGGLGVARELSDDQMKASTEIGKLLLAEGIIFAGIDMIGNSLTEINITSPTGAREILSQTGRSPIQALLQSI